MTLGIHYYILVGRTPIAVDIHTWAEQQEARRTDKVDRWRVGLETITPQCEVSTVFLGLDHSWGQGEPILFETLVFGGPMDGEMKRYCTYAQAERGHVEMVTEARKACVQVQAIANAAGAKENKP